MNTRAHQHAGIYYEVIGRGYPLVLLHGHTLDTRMWEPQLEALASRFQVIRLDLRGYGRSELPGQAPFHYADDLLGLLDHLGIRQTHLLGLSLGGNVALDFAIHYPERVGALVLAGSSLKGFPPLPDAAALLATIPAEAQEAGLESARTLWLAHPFFAPALHNPQAARLLKPIVEGYSGFHWSTGYPPSQPIRDVSGRLDELRAKTLVLVGELDTEQNHRVATYLVARIPDVRKGIIGGAGHMVNLEAPQTFNTTVLRFLSEASGWPSQD
jgi:pimeloyl-ACP methyl ester carboxylesterase